MSSQWKTLLETLDARLAAVPKEQQPQEDLEGEQGEELGQRVPEGEQPEGEAEGATERAAAVAALNHTLVEIHSRLKALDEEIGDALFGNGGSPSPDGAPGGEPAAAVLSSQVARDLAARCVEVLTNGSREVSARSHAFAAQLLAELGRSEVGRAVCLAQELGVAAALESALLGQRKGRPEPRGVETIVQICRVLGNLCFDYPEGRRSIMATKSLEHLKHLSGDHERLKRDDPAQRLAVILPGFLLNFANETPDAVEQIGHAGLVDVVLSNILTTKTNDAVFNASLTFVMVFAEEDAGRKLLSKCKSLPRSLKHVLENTTSPEVTEAALEVLRAAVQEPELAEVITTVGHDDLFGCLVDLVGGQWKAASTEFAAHRTSACELVVVTASHEPAARVILRRGMTEVFVRWLREDDDGLLRVTGALVLGNLAFDEQSCANLVQGGTSAMLITLLQAHLDPHKDLKLQHALLGALRNLSVAPCNRPRLLEQGLIQPCMALLPKLNLISGHQVIFKALGTLRLVIEGNGDAARTVVGDRNVVSAVVDLANCDSTGVKAESARLLATLIKNGLGRRGESGDGSSNNPSGASDGSFRHALISSGAVAVVTAMLISTTHVRMANEALLALTILAASASGGESGGDDEVHRHLQTDLVINGVKLWLGKDEPPAEVKRNAFSLIRQLLLKNRDEFAQMLVDLEFPSVLSALIASKDSSGEPALGSVGKEEAEALLNDINSA